MIKLIYFLFAFLANFFVLASNLFAQENYNFHTQIIYQMTYQPDTADKERISTEDFELLIDDDISLFRSIKRCLYNRFFVSTNTGAIYGDI